MELAAVANSPRLALDVLNDVHPELPISQFSKKMREAIQNDKA